MIQIKSVSLTGTIILCLLLLLLVPQALATVYTINGTQIQSGNLSPLIRDDPSLISGILQPGTVLFFTNSHCGACRGAGEYLKGFAAVHPEVTLNTYDLSAGIENRAEFEKYKGIYHLQHLSTPSVMIGNLTLEGNQDIEDHFAEIISAQQEQTNQPISSPLQKTQLSPPEGVQPLLILKATIMSGISRLIK